MARALRIQFAGAIYHVVIRGNGGQRIFIDQKDRKRFLSQLTKCVETFRVRVYLFCLMGNHVHLVIETPQRNLSQSMHKLQTGYAVYFNLRHRRRGHVTQGRFGARLVQGDEYLLALSRYVHLNPVFVGEVKKLPLDERIEILRNYKWSSYCSYIGMAEELDFVDYGPVRAMMYGNSGQKRREYRKYVETGIAETDDEFLKVMKASALSIGEESFRQWVHDLHIDLTEARERKEDISFRRRLKVLTREEIMGVLAAESGMDLAEICRRRRGSMARAIAARMLCKYGGLSQREVALILNLNTGSAVSYQLRNLREGLGSNRQLRNQLAGIERRMEQTSRSP